MRMSLVAFIISFCLLNLSQSSYVFGNYPTKDENWVI
jgi:hypothetical protein